MKVVLFTLISFVLSQAIASSEHDRVCVGTIQGQDSESTSFVLQWSIERTYDEGQSSQDNHQLTVQARSCVDSFSDLCTVVKPKATILAPQAKPLVPVKLVDGDKAVFFEGQLDFSREVLVGQIKGTESTIQLQCVTQPFLNLK
jgi:hypothetical protein